MLTCGPRGEKQPGGCVDSRLKYNVLINNFSTDQAEDLLKTIELHLQQVHQGPMEEITTIVLSLRTASKNLWR